MIGNGSDINHAGELFKKHL